MTEPRWVLLFTLADLGAALALLRWILRTFRAEP